MRFESKGGVVFRGAGFGVFVVTGGFIGRVGGGRGVVFLLFRAIGEIRGIG